MKQNLEQRCFYSTRATDFFFSVEICFRLPWNASSTLLTRLSNRDRARAENEKIKRRVLTVLNTRWEQIKNVSGKVLSEFFFNFSRFKSVIAKSLFEFFQSANK